MEHSVKVLASHSKLTSLRLSDAQRARRLWPRVSAGRVSLSHTSNSRLTDFKRYFSVHLIRFGNFCRNLRGEKSRDPIASTYFLLSSSQHHESWWNKHFHITIANQFRRVLCQQELFRLKSIPDSARSTLWCFNHSELLVVFHLRLKILFCSVLREHSMLSDFLPFWSFQCLKSTLDFFVQLNSRGK